MSEAWTNVRARSADAAARCARAATLPLLAPKRLTHSGRSSSSLSEPPMLPPEHVDEALPEQREKLKNKIKQASKQKQKKMREEGRGRDGERMEMRG